MITVKAWIIDGGAFQLHHCKADDFLMSATAGATLNAFAFVVSHASAAGMLLSSGEVTMRASVKQRCVVSVFVCYCCLCTQVAFSVCLSVLGNAFLPLREQRVLSGEFAATQAPRTGALLLQHIIRFIMFVQHAVLRYCHKIHGHFVLSFPSRANVVKVTNLSVVGTEAWISWTSEIFAVAWRFK